MKGYAVHCGYMGWTGSRYMLFATEDEYMEFVREQQAVSNMIREQLQKGGEQ